LLPLLERLDAPETKKDEAKDYAKDNFDWSEMDVKKILQEGGFLPAEAPATQTASLLKRAKAIKIDPKAVEVFLQLTQELFAEHVYANGEPDQLLKDITRRDTSWRIHKADWEAMGAHLERSGGLPLNSLLVVIQLDPNKAVAPGKPKPVIYAAGIRYGDEPAIFLYVNGNTTKQDAIMQLNPSSEEYDNMALIFEHEFAHLYDYQANQESLRMREDEVDLADEAVYFNLPPEVRGWTVSLIHEAKSWLSRGQKVDKGNGLVDAFLRESEVWKTISEHLNAQNRKFALRELGRAMAEMRGDTHGPNRTQVDDRSPVGRRG
jgi:hypothetical protein